MKKIIIAAMLSILAAPAVAADSPFYAGLKIGSANKSVGGTSESSSAAGMFIGYSVSPSFAIEAGYTNLGSVAGGLITFSAMDIGAVGLIPINDKFSMYGKLGFASTSEELLGVKGTRSAPTFGFGGQFDVSPKLGVRVGWDRHSFGDGTNFNQGDTSFVSAGAVFKF
ncbi:MAG: porin family protein [Sideroxydans sp.]|nr:porin family protein [Sideroxydans sp.]